jgi:hypothetical protein
MSSPARSSLALTARIRATAPKVSLRVLGKADTNVDELRRGYVDIQLTDQTAHPADVRSMTRMTDIVGAPPPGSASSWDPSSCC